jgi:bifunctional DNA-binding transcriptional regulator/antitoxin component of YhaV-PrlF toxin-antitoxin module
MITLRASPVSPASTKATHPTKLLVNNTGHQDAMALDHGVFGVDKRGRFHLPAAARNRCRLSTGDRLLLAAYPDGGLLVVHAPAALDEVVDRVYAEALKGERDE